MFSLNKILVLAAIILAVWYGFKLISRLDRAHRTKHATRPAQDDRAQHADPSNSARSNSAPANSDTNQDGPETVTLVRGKDGKTFAPRLEDLEDSGKG